MEESNIFLENGNYFSLTKEEKYIMMQSETINTLQGENGKDQQGEMARKRHRQEVINRLIKNGAHISEETIYRMDAYADWGAMYNVMMRYGRIQAKKKQNKEENKARAKAKKKAKARAKRKAKKR